MTSGGRKKEERMRGERLKVKGGRENKKCRPEGLHFDLIISHVWLMRSN